MNKKILHIPGSTSEEDLEDEAETKPVTIMLPADVIALIDEVAEEEGLTRSNVMRGLLRYAMESVPDNEATFDFFVTRRPDGRIMVQIGSTSEDLDFWVYLSAYLVRSTAMKMGLPIEEAVRMICDKAGKFEDLIVRPNQFIGGDDR